MTEMHEQRADFVQRVQNNVANDLEKTVSNSSRFR